MKFGRLILIVTAFAIAMGFLESAVVVYMREILYPGGFAFPLSPIPVNLALTELFREVATLVMLISIGVLAGRSFSTGFAWFIYSFAIWDIFYYVFLWLLLGWPESLMTWDVLFLIPTTWTGPVLSPVLVSLSMILLAMVILLRAGRGLESRIPGKIWAGLILGSLILIFGFVLDYSQHMLTHFSLLEMLQVKNPEVLEAATAYIPLRFAWWIFGAGEALILASIAWYWKQPAGSL
ncbi:MAG: hypothetical protein P1P86_15945 [Bacteroidales bacterium]|nr:hypothetical protein [Bacteroidales bacterium]